MSYLRSVSIIGSGNWGSTIGKIVASNIINIKEYKNEVFMWVFDEMINNEKLSQIINTKHENVKYLSGIKLPANLIAEPDLEKCAKDADVLIFVLPHQFLANVCKTIKGVIKPGAHAVSLIKGLNEKSGVGISLLSDLIREQLSVPCSVLMGANLAYEISQEKYCESTVACSDSIRGKELKNIFQTAYFRISVITDEVGAELCGALKNIVAVGAGLSDGLGFGDNTKAAIIRLGFMEMRHFIYEFFADRNIQDSTFLESCGFADLVTTCYGGRNKRIGMALVGSNKTLAQLERELLNGQSAQGPLTAKEVFGVIEKRGLLEKYPIFAAVHRICERIIEPQTFIDCIREHPQHLL